MPFLVIASQTIPVTLNAARRKDVEVGEVRRAFSGAPRSSVRAYVREWEGVETRWISRAQADTFRSALEGAPPLAASGDLTGSVNVYIRNVQEVEKGRKIISGSAVEAVRLSFDILQA